MTLLAAYPDTERAVCDLLAGLGTTGTETTPDVQASTPYIRVRRTGGLRTRTTDTADVEISVFAADASAAKDVAGQIEQLLATGPVMGSGTSWQTSHGQIDTASNNSGPVMVPATDSANLRQVTASYQVTIRRP